MMFGDGAADFDYRRFLEGIGADHAGGNLAGDGDERNAIELGIGDGFTFYASTPPNIQSTPLGASLGWQQVTWPGTGVYVVPANPTFTRIDLTCQGPVGSQIWLDQFTVSIQ